MGVYNLDINSVADILGVIFGQFDVSILNVDLESELLKKINKNKHREYKIIDGVNTRVKEYNEK